MSVKPILFSTEMVQAILDGRKTVTRRVIKGNVPLNDWKFHELHDNRDGAITCGKNKLCAGFYTDDHIFYIDGEKRIDAHYYAAPYRHGDILYVREGAEITGYGVYSLEDDDGGGYVDCRFFDGEKMRFKIPENEYQRIICKYNSVQKEPYSTPKFSPYWLTKHEVRIWLKVRDVRVERLQEITEEQTEEEGFTFTPPCLRQVSEDSYCDLDGPCTSKVKYCDMSSGELFGKVLWDSTIQKQDNDNYGWDANPWVWVIQFERCEKPEEDKT